jgi:NifU-like protein involved in Fe-S cluster formation
MTIGPLSEEVWALFRALNHAGDPGDSGSAGAAAGVAHWLCGEAGSEQDGTRVRFALRIEGRRVLEARYRTYGCPHTLAACEWLAAGLGGCELATLSPAGLAQLLGGPLDWARRLAVPAAKLGRLLVVEDALREAFGRDVSRFDPAVTKGA